MVFRPFINEVIIGRVRSCSADGIRVSLDFFDDIFIPKSNIISKNEFRIEGGRNARWVSNIGAQQNFPFAFFINIYFLLIYIFY